MDIKKSVHDITITSEECYSIACAFYSQIKRSIEVHYIHHPPNVFDEQVGPDIFMMDKFFALSNFSYLSEMYKREFNKMLTEKTVNK